MIETKVQFRKDANEHLERVFNFQNQGVTHIVVNKDLLLNTEDKVMLVDLVPEVILKQDKLHKAVGDRVTHLHISIGMIAKERKLIPIHWVKTKNKVEIQVTQKLLDELSDVSIVG